MDPAYLKVVLDANVLFPFTLRDTLLRAAADGYFQVYWSDEILDEARRNLVGSGTIAEEQAVRLVDAMSTAFPEAKVTGYESIVPAMPNDEKDRHVAAAAVTAEAQLIVTNNLKDFRSLPEGIEACSPDDLLRRLYDLDPEGIVDILRHQSAALKTPPRSLEELVAGLAKLVPGFAAAVRTFLASPQ
ncbi:PIN domain-containing protein [Planctomycetota bacterium]